MPGSIRMAVASDSEEEINAHFGDGEHYLVYQISPEDPADRRSPTDGADEADDVPGRSS